MRCARPSAARGSTSSRWRPKRREGAAGDGIPVGGKPATVRGDAPLLRRMIRNLIDNARRHGGDIAPEISTGASGPWIMITVRDHGRGIPAPAREGVFAAVYRLPR